VQHGLSRNAHDALPKATELLIPGGVSLTARYLIATINIDNEAPGRRGEAPGAERVSSQPGYPENWGTRLLA
jgi:hypothetical protein